MCDCNLRNMGMRDEDLCSPVLPIPYKPESSNFHEDISYLKPVPHMSMVADIKPLFIVTESTSDKKGRNPSISVYVSQILRGFRSHIKAKFEKVYGGINHRRWNDEQFRKKVKAFFT